MNPRKRAFSLTVLAILVGSGIPLSAEEESPLMRDAARFAAAVQEVDFDTLLELSHPRSVELVGGKDAYIAQVEAVWESAKQQGLEMVSFEVSEPSDPVRVDEELHATVRQTLRMRVPGATVESSSFFYAISADDGRSWTFVEGAELLGEDNFLNELVPNYDPALPLPEPRSPRVLRDDPQG